MGYRELHRMEIEEVARRWHVKESQRAIARAIGLARETVKKYLAAAINLGLATGPPSTEAQLVQLRRRVVAVQPVKRVAPQVAMLEPYRERIATWLDQDHLLLTCIQEFARRPGREDEVHDAAPPCAPGGAVEAFAFDGAHGTDGTRRGRRDGFRQARYAHQSRYWQTPGG